MKARQPRRMPDDDWQSRFVRVRADLVSSRVPCGGMMASATSVVSSLSPPRHAAGLLIAAMQEGDLDRKLLSNTVRQLGAGPIADLLEARKLSIHAMAVLDPVLVERLANHLHVAGVAPSTAAQWQHAAADQRALARRRRMSDEAECPH